MTYDWNLLCRSRWLALTGIGFVALGCVTAANAQSPVTMGTNVKGVRVVAPPPAGFNPLTATANERQMYGVPPEPDAVHAPSAHALWAQSMAHFSDPRDTNVEVKVISDRFNGPNRPAGRPTQQANGQISTTSSNWSGTAVFSSGTPFSTEAILGIFNVPAAHVALGTCTDTWVYSSQWVGVDGYNNSDVFQAGVEADAKCSGNTTTPLYSAWIEWYPYAETQVSSPVINPADELLVEVWNTSSTTGYAYFHDVSTGVIAEYALDAPGGTTLAGKSVEWIVERPGVNGGLATLTNYIDVPWVKGIAWNYKASSPTYYYIGQNPPSNTLAVITMLDNNNKAISFPSIIGPDFLWVAAGGSAY